MAITFGTIGDNGSQGTTSFSYNNVAGDFLFVYAEGTTAITGVTYNGVAMTQIGTNQASATAARTLNIWGLVAPATGSNTVAISGGANQVVGVVGIAGVNQTSVAAAATGFAKSSVLTSTTPSQAVTTTVDNAFVIAGTIILTYASMGANTTDVGSLLADANVKIIRSSNAVTPAGSFTLNLNTSPGTETTFVAVGINPPVTGPTNLKSLNTNVKANIKSYNTNLIANIKSINTNT